MTALQLTNAFAAIANGGRLLRPYVVEEIGMNGERRPAREPVTPEWPISPSSVRQVRSMLESVVLDGTAKSAALPGYRAAGKTGTAQKAVPGRGYAANKYIASFVGFAPIKNPALVAVVALDEPWPRYHGGEVAAPAWQAMARQILLHLGVTPDQEEPRALPPPVRIDVAQQTSPRVAVPDGTIPDFAGLSARAAVALSADTGLHLALNGHGAVQRQLPAPGTPLEEAGDTVEVWLETTARKRG